jgi:hypothetical protein
MRNGRDFLLKRSYSFGFERILASERMVLEPATEMKLLEDWNKRPSSFGSLGKPRVFSFRYYRRISRLQLAVVFRWCFRWVRLAVGGGVAAGGGS